MGCWRRNRFGFGGGIGFLQGLRGVATFDFPPPARLPVCVRPVCRANGTGRRTGRRASAPPPHQPSPVGSASATPPQGGSNGGCSGAGRHPRSWVFRGQDALVPGIFHRGSSEVTDTADNHSVSGLCSGLIEFSFDSLRPSPTTGRSPSSRKRRTLSLFYAGSRSLP